MTSVSRQRNSHSSAARCTGWARGSALCAATRIRSHRGWRWAGFPGASSSFSLWRRAARQKSLLWRWSGFMRAALAVPLLFVAETALDAKFRNSSRCWSARGSRDRALCRNWRPPPRAPTLEGLLVADATSLLAATALSLLSARIRLSGQGAHETSQELAAMPLAAAWYWFICLPLFRFLMVRWGWRLAFWWVGCGSSQR